MIDEDLDGGAPAPGPAVEPPHAGDKRKARAKCPECDKTVGNLPSHLAQVHGIRGANANKAKRDRSPSSAGGGNAHASPAELGEAIGMLYAMAGQMWAASDPVCGGALVAAAPNISKAWAHACESSPMVQRFAESMMGGGALVGLALAHAPIVFTVFAHHGPAARAAQQEAELAEWEAQQRAAAAAAGEDWIPPGSVPADHAYGPYAPGSADSAR